MSPTRRQLKSLIKEIRSEDIFLDQASDAVLSRWEDDNDALDALKDILARAEKANGAINVFDVENFIKLVLTIKSYAEKTDRDWARLVKLRREIKHNLPKERTRLAKALSKGRISSQYAIQKMGEFNQIVVGSTPPPVRSSKGGSRVRTLFMRELSAAVHEDLGAGRMDDRVAAIARMVLENDNIGPEQVRNARRARS
jgi:hypothetical protein